MGVPHRNTILVKQSREKPYQRRGKKKKKLDNFRGLEFVYLLWIPYLPLPTLHYGMYLP